MKTITTLCIEPVFSLPAASHHQSPPNLTPNWDHALSSFALRCRSQNFSGPTLRLYAQKLLGLRRWLEVRGLQPATVQPIDLRDFLARCKVGACSKTPRTVSDQTVDGYFRVMRTFFRFLNTEGLRADNPMARVERPRCERRFIRPVTPEQLQMIFAAIDASPIHSERDRPLITRDRAMVSLLDATGMRLSEVLSLKVTDVNLERGAIVVFGKGRKERPVFFHEEAARDLRSWISVRTAVTTKDWLWVGRNGDQLSANAFEHRFKYATRRAGIAARRLSPHCLRHAFAKRFLRKGGNVMELQKLLGHTSLDMVRNYVNLSDDDLLEAYRRVHAPNAAKQAPVQAFAPAGTPLAAPAAHSLTTAQMEPRGGTA